MKIETKVIKLSKIKLNPENPRLIKDEKFNKLKKSIEEFPEMKSIREIVVDENMIILGGNMRFRAMQELGIKETTVKIVSELTEQQKKEFIIKDNVGFGEWDWDIIANEWNNEPYEEWGLELPVNLVEEENVEATEDDYKIPEEIKTDIVLGDLFEIGQHRLLCGDSTDSDQVAKLMNGEKADMIFTDPPYGVNYEQTNAGKSSRSRSRSVIEGDEKSVTEISEVLWRPSFKNLYDNAKDDCCYYMTMCQGGDQMMMMMMMMMSENWKVKHELIWVKSCPVFSMGRLDYDYQHEPIIYGWKKKHNFYGKGKFIKSIWEISKPSKSELHPTMKPIELIENMLLNSSLENNIILDKFLGSGSTMVAAHQLNRKCYGMEISPQYCQVIIDRMRKLDNTIVIKRNGIVYET